MSEGFFPTTPIDPEEIAGIKGALTRYRITAWIVGTLLVILVFVGVPLKYLAGQDLVSSIVGVGHGWLFMLMVIFAIDLGRRDRWTLKWYAFIVVAGLVPFVTFVAEHFATKHVRATVAAVEENSTAA